MQNSDRLIYKIVMICILTAIPLQAVSAFSGATDSYGIEILVKDKFEGGWGYNVEGAPEGYQEGFLLIVKDENSYKVRIQTGAGTMVGENVRTKGSSIMFDVMVEGDKVAVVLKMSGSSFTGTTTSSQGTFIVSGNKTLSQG